MIAQPETPKIYSLDDYLELETASTERHEYIDGAIVPMTGGTPNHNRIIRNLCTWLTVGLRDHPYEVFVADQRLWIPQRKLYTYPDVMVVEGELVYQENRNDTLTNPCFIVEVLSKSTRDYDRGDKFLSYRTIPTFREYVLVDQYTHHVEHYAKRDEKRWIFQEYDEANEQLELITIPWTISFQELYSKVTFISEDL